MNTVRRIPIDVPSDPHGAATALHVERGAIARLEEVLAESGVVVTDRRVLLVVDRNVGSLAARAAARLAAAGAEVSAVHLEASEVNKSLASVESIWQAGLAHRLGRGGLIAAVGGGIIGDVAGFAAATFLRGVELIQVPTTLLAMVDAAIGGKTGVNLDLPGGGLGKNLAGAFWQPRLTVADPDALDTLPRRELRAGLAECIKHAVIAGEPLFGELESIIEQAAAGDARTLDRIVPAAAAVKAGIVSRDPHEQGDRALLNLGHTFGHAMETLPGVGLLHGEAVAIGMVAACRCAVARGVLGASDADRVERLIARAGLPVCLPTDAGSTDAGAEILRRMGFDKKVDRHALRLILPHGVGDVRVVPVSMEAGSAGAFGEDGVQAGIAAITAAR